MLDLHLLGLMLLRLHLKFLTSSLLELIIVSFIIIEFATVEVHYLLTNNIEELSSMRDYNDSHLTVDQVVFKPHYRI